MKENPRSEKAKKKALRMLENDLVYMTRIGTVLTIFNAAPYSVVAIFDLRDCIKGKKK